MYHRSRGWVMSASPAKRSGVCEFGRDVHNCQSSVTFKGFALIDEMESGIFVVVGSSGGIVVLKPLW